MSNMELQCLFNEIHGNMTKIIQVFYSNLENPCWLYFPSDSHCPKEMLLSPAKVERGFLLLFKSHNNGGGLK